MRCVSFDESDFFALTLTSIKVRNSLKLLLGLEKAFASAVAQGR